jgi:hypothetical protein
MTKKEFKELASHHKYGKHYNAFYFDWVSKISNEECVVGYKFGVYAHTDNCTKAELFNIIYNWAINEVQPPWYVNYKFAPTDEKRFKVPLSLGGF